MTFTVLSHTADTGIEAEAATFVGLLEAMATGMFKIMGTVDERSPPLEVTFEVSSPNPEDMLVDVLSELLYRSEVDDAHFVQFEVTPKGDDAIRITARGVPIDDVEPEGPPIKAVTYHDVVVRETDDGWYGRVYFDV